jgi:hypothetical protein
VKFLMAVRTSCDAIVLLVAPEKASGLNVMGSEILEATLLDYTTWISGAPRRL